MVDVVFCDIRLPDLDLDGFTLLKELRRRFILIPVVMITGYGSAAYLEESVRDYANWFIQKESTSASLLAAIAESAPVRGGLLLGVQAVAKTLDGKDPYSAEHSENVRKWSMALAAELKWKDLDVFRIGVAALLHDIGKVGIPDSILNKPAKPNEAERKTLDTHAELSYEIARCFYRDREVLLGILYNHRSYCGRFGYPMGDGLLRKIPTDYQVKDPERFSQDEFRFAHVIHIVDSFDTMASARAYKRGWSIEDTLEELVRCSLENQVVNQRIAKDKIVSLGSIRRDRMGKACQEYNPDLVRAFIEVVRRTYGECETFDNYARKCETEVLLLTNVDACKKQWRASGSMTSLGQPVRCSDRRDVVWFIDWPTGTVTRADVEPDGTVRFETED